MDALHVGLIVVVVILLAILFSFYRLGSKALRDFWNSF